MGKAGKIVRLVRVMRVLRIFKLVRYFTALQSLMFTLNQVQGCISGDAFKLFWLRLTKNLACWCSLLGFASSLLRRWSSLQRRYTCFTNYQKNTFDISRYSLQKVPWFGFYLWQFRITRLALGRFLTQSGGGSWLSLLSGEAINDIIAVFVLFTMKNQDVIFSFHGILHLQIWWHRSSVVCRKSYGRTLRSLWHFHSHSSTANRCQQVGSTHCHWG